MYVNVHSYKKEPLHFTTICRAISFGYTRLYKIVYENGFLILYKSDFGEKLVIFMKKETIEIFVRIPIHSFLRLCNEITFYRNNIEL